jgi:hypothetical protein
MPSRRVLWGSPVRFAVSSYLPPASARDSLAATTESRGAFGARHISDDHGSAFSFRLIGANITELTRAADQPSLAPLLLIEGLRRVGEILDLASG